MTRGYQEALNALIDHGFDLNTADDKGMTPLMQCVNFRWWGVVETKLLFLHILLEKGANPFLCNKDGDDAFVIAGRNHNYGALDALFAAYPNVPLPIKNKAFLPTVKALVAENVPGNRHKLKLTLQVLINRGAQIDLVNEDNLTSLQQAVVQKNMGEWGSKSVKCEAAL